MNECMWGVKQRVTKPGGNGAWHYRVNSGNFPISLFTPRSLAGGMGTCCCCYCLLVGFFSSYPYHHAWLFAIIIVNTLTLLCTIALFYGNSSGRYIHIGKVEKQQTQSLELNQFHFMGYTRKLSRILCTYFLASELWKSHISSMKFNQSSRHLQFAGASHDCMLPHFIKFQHIICTYTWIRWNGDNFITTS